MVDWLNRAREPKYVRPARGVLVKTMSMGTSDEVVARIFLQILNIRDHVVGQNQRKVFDSHYTPIQQNVFEARIAKDRCVQLIREHQKKIESSLICRHENGIIYVDESIDDDLNLQFKDIFIRFWMTFDGIKAFLLYLGFDVGFLFVDTDGDFEKGKSQFLIKHNTERFQKFVRMIEDDRKTWIRSQKKFRNKIEHRGFQFPKIDYALSENGAVVAIISRVDGLDVTEYLTTLWQNFFTFCEEIVVFFLSEKLPEHLLMYEIPEVQRSQEAPIKYQVGLNPTLQARIEKL